MSPDAAMAARNKATVRRPAGENLNGGRLEV
jgi:hypothetical protein